MLTSIVRQFKPDFRMSIPTPQEFYAELQKTKYTPDLAELEQYAWQAIFVCDEFKRKHMKHDLLGEDAQYQYPAYTQKKYQFWDPIDPTEHLVPFEVSMMTKHVVGFPPIANIKGEVFLIRPRQFLLLDEWKQNTVQFNRRRVRVVVPNRSIKWVRDRSQHHFFNSPEQFYNNKTLTDDEVVTIVRAWMYEGNPSHYDAIITAYDWGHVETFHSKNRTWLPEYYHVRRTIEPTK